MLHILDESVQQIINDEFFSANQQVTNDMVLNLNFMRHFGNRLSGTQLKGILLLKESGFDDIAQFVAENRKETVDRKWYLKMIDKFTLADRIKGNARIRDVLKASVSNPSTNISMAEVQPKALRESELK